VIDLLQAPLSNLWPAVALALGFPLVMLLLNEVGSLASLRQSPLPRALRTVRNLVVPTLAAVIFVEQVLELSADSTVARLAETTFWIALLYALLGLLNDLLLASASNESWVRRVPSLFTDLLRIVLVSIGAMVIYSQVWGQEVEGALTALGLGSVVIGLALQEPLGNLVSGLMLMFERPLRVGDWITVGDVTGKVIEINWRSVHIQTPTRELQIVPNVELYKASFSNLSRPTDVRTEVLELGFSYDDPPNRVKGVLLELLGGTPGVLTDPAPLVRTVGYGDFSIAYKLIFSVARQEELYAIRDQIMTHLWYVIRREGLSIPFPITMEYSPSENPGRPARPVQEWLRDHPRFKPALGEHEDAATRVIDYAAGETIQQPGARFEGFALILSGKASLLARGPDGQPVAVGEIGPGECFGDQLRAGSAMDDLAIVARDDVKLVVFENAAIAQLLTRSPTLATEIGDAIERRLKAAQQARQRH
jgi:small-conductance mechanosensitive channel